MEDILLIGGIALVVYFVGKKLVAGATNVVSNTTQAAGNALATGVSNVYDMTSQGQIDNNITAPTSSVVAPVTTSSVSLPSGATEPAGSLILDDYSESPDGTENLPVNSIDLYGAGFF